MKLRFDSIYYLLLILILVACGGGGADVDYEAIAKSLEDAFNSEDVDTLVSFWSDVGSIEFYFDQNDLSDFIACRGEDRDCWQKIIERSDLWRFSDFFAKGSSILCFTYETGTGDGNWERISQGHLRFDGDKISFFGPGCL